MPPFFSITAVGIALERMAEGVVGGQEKPGVAAGLDDGLAGAVGQRPGVVGPVDRVGAAVLAGQVGGGGAGYQEHLVLLLGDGVDGERDRGGRHVDHHVDLSTSNHWRTMLEPTSGLFWWSANTTSILSWHLFALQKSSIAFFAAHTEPWPGKVRIGAGLVVHDADLDDAIADIAPGPSAAPRAQPPRLPAAFILHRIGYSFLP